MTINQILNYTQGTNTPFELQGAKSYIERHALRINKPASISTKHLRYPNLDVVTQNISYVGIEVKTRYSEQYYWFMTFDDVNDPDAYWFFDHAYNRNNGQITKKKGARVYKLIEKIENHK